MNEAYNILISKLNRFIRKYYMNLMIKGSILSVIILLLLFLAVSVIEYFSWSDTITRAVVFYAFLSLAFFVMLYYILVPLAKLIRIGKTLSYEEAAKIVGSHFSEVSDKLLNALQLHTIGSPENMELLMASIEQKAKEINPVPFSKAVSYKTNFRYLKYGLPVFLILAAILLVSPSLVIEPTQRIINHNTEYVKPLPYSLELLNDGFSIPQHSEFKVTILAKGDEIPSKIWVDDGKYNYRAAEIEPGLFEYVFKDVANDLYFQIKTEDFLSSKYHVAVFPRPVIYNIVAHLEYPDYLNLQDEIIENGGDLIVLEGTRISWEIFTRDTRNIAFYINDQLNNLWSTKSNVFNYDITASRDFNYSLLALNEYMRSNDSMYFNVQVIKDEFPSITVKEFHDENVYGLVNFFGSIADDHGFYSLNFVFRKDTTPEINWSRKPLLIEKGVSEQRFDYLINTSDFNLGPGESLAYFFEVRDNDTHNGFKSTRSDMYYYRMPDSRELEEKLDNSTDDLKSLINQSVKEINKINEQIEDTRLNLFEKKDLSWTDKQQLADLIDKKEQLKNQLDDMKKLNKEIKELEDLLKKKISPELAEKLKELEELFNELFDKELQEEIEKLKEELEKENISDLLDKLKEQNEDLKNDLEQNLELFKQMEFEQMMEDAISELEKLGEKQEELGEKTKNKELSKEEGIKKQEETSEEFNDLMEKLKEADKLNKELQDPYNMKLDTVSADNIEQEMDDAKENLEKGKKNKASESQKNAGQKMKKMANSLSMMMAAAMMEQMGEDIELIRNMLDNLLDLSFEQENIITEFNNIGRNDPKNTELRDKQKGVKDEFIVINDSLTAMSKRQIAIRSFVVKEAGKINSYIDRALDNMQELKQGAALSEQQYAMTSMNNLSLMLAESLEQMQQSMQMQGGKQGSSKCKNPGQGSSPSMSEILKQQQGMNEGMKGKMKKEGEEGKNGINKNSEELARMAAAQGEIRRMLQEFIEQFEAEGGNGSSLNKIVEEMQKTEDDIINRRLSFETLERQKDIETRLLKSDKALQEREKEQKRESKEGKNKNSGNQNQELEYKSENENQEEILITRPIEVKPYYKKLLKEYLYKL